MIDLYGSENILPSLLQNTFSNLIVIHYVFM